MKGIWIFGIAALFAGTAVAGACWDACGSEYSRADMQAFQAMQARGFTPECPMESETGLPRSTEVRDCGQEYRMCDSGDYYCFNHLLQECCHWNALKIAEQERDFCLAECGPEADSTPQGSSDAGTGNIAPEPEADVCGTGFILLAFGALGAFYAWRGD